MPFVTTGLASDMVTAALHWILRLEVVDTGEIRFIDPTARQFLGPYYGGVNSSIRSPRSRAKAT